MNAPFEKIEFQVRQQLKHRITPFVMVVNRRSSKVLGKEFTMLSFVTTLRKTVI